MSTAGTNERKIRAQLDRLRAEIETLKAKASDNSSESQTKFERYLETLDEKSNDVGEKLESLKDASDEAINDITKGLKDALGRLEIAKRAAKARFH